MLARGLTFTNKHSLLILAGGVFIGLLFPGIASLLRPMLGLSVFIFLLGTFLRTDVDRLKAALADQRTSLLLPALIIVAAPVLLAACLSLFPLDKTVFAAIVLTAACPPSTMNAPLARSLGGDHATALSIVLVSTLCCPFTIPMIAGFFMDLDLSSLALGRNVAFYVFGSGAIAILLLWTNRRAVENTKDGLDVLVTTALVVFAIGCMDGVQERLIAAPMSGAQIVAIIVAINVFFLIIGSLLGAGNANERLAYGLPFANRNVGLVWAAIGLGIDPVIAFYFALSQLPIFALPAILKIVLGAQRA